MTIEEMTRLWTIWTDTHAWDEDSVLEFCGIYATSLEEYWCMNTLLMAIVHDC